MKRPSVLALMLIAGLSSAESAPPKQTKAIEAEVARIDAMDDAPESAGYRRLEKELPHWQFSGLLEGSKPTRLSALFQEGNAVREETYYLHHETVFLVKVKKWWDMDDDRKAPEPATEQTFPHPAAAFVERSRLITQILLGTTKDDTAAAHSLEAFPETKSKKPSKNESATVEFPEVQMSIIIPLQREYPSEKSPIQLPSSVVRHFKVPESLKADGLQGEYRTQKLPWGVVFEWNTPTKGAAYFSYACRQGDDFCLKVGPYTMVTLDWPNATFKKRSAANLIK